MRNKLLLTVLMVSLIGFLALPTFSEAASVKPGPEPGGGGGTPPPPVPHLTVHVTDSVTLAPIPNVAVCMDVNNPQQPGAITALGVGCPVGVTDASGNYSQNTSNGIAYDLWIGDSTHCSSATTYTQPSGSFTKNFAVKIIDTSLRGSAGAMQCKSQAGQ